MINDFGQKGTVVLLPYGKKEIIAFFFQKEKEEFPFSYSTVLALFTSLWASLSKDFQDSVCFIQLDWDTVLG